MCVTTEEDLYLCVCGGVGAGGGCKKVSGGGLGNIWTDVFATTLDVELTKQFSLIQMRNCHERQAVHLEVLWQHLD